MHFVICHFEAKYTLQMTSGDGLGSGVQLQLFIWSLHVLLVPKRSIPVFAAAISAVLYLEVNRGNLVDEYTSLHKSRSLHTYACHYIHIMPYKTLMCMLIVPCSAVLTSPPLSNSLGVVVGTGGLIFLFFSPAAIDYVCSNDPLA